MRGRSLLASHLKHAGHIAFRPRQAPWYSLTDITFQDGVLYFDVVFDNSGGTMIIKFQMKVDGDSMGFLLLLFSIRQAKWIYSACQYRR